MSREDIKNEAMRKTIGKRFKEFREFINKSQTELADELQVRQGCISNIESGKLFPNLDVQHYLFHQYHLNINWLLNGIEEMIMPMGKNSEHNDLTIIFSHIKEAGPRFQRYFELISLMRIPVIEDIILARLDEVKKICKEEIKEFYEELKKEIKID